MKKILLNIFGLFFALPVLAQGMMGRQGDFYPMGGPMAFGIGYFMASYFWLLFAFGIAYYVAMAYALMRLAKKLNYKDAWMAWVPLLNVWLLIQLAGLEWWWILIVLFGGIVPVVGNLVSILAAFYLWMKIAEKCNKDKWFALLMFIPIVNIWAIFELGK